MSRALRLLALWRRVVKFEAAGAATMAPSGLKTAAQWLKSRHKKSNGRQISPKKKYYLETILHPTFSRTVGKDALALRFNGLVRLDPDCPTTSRAKGSLPKYVMKAGSADTIVSLSVI